jgi:hypothetical protein
VKALVIIGGRAGCMLPAPLDKSDAGFSHSYISYCVIHSHNSPSVGSDFFGDGGEGERDLTDFKYIILYRVLFGQLFAVYSDIRKTNFNTMT